MCCVAALRSVGPVNCDGRSVCRAKPEVTRQKLVTRVTTPNHILDGLPALQRFDVDRRANGVAVAARLLQRHT